MLELNLPKQTEVLLRERAKASGQDVAAFAALILQNVLSTDFDELLGPVRNQVQASGVSDEELDALCEEARNEVWQAAKTK